MKTLVIGDLHGQVEIVERVLAMDCPVIFLGDYLDSFTRSVPDQVRTLTMVLDAIEEKPYEVVGLMGNHELSYLEKGMRCSGFNAATFAYVTQMESRIRKLLKPYVFCENFLVSHAGLSKRLLKQLEINFLQYLQDEDFEQIGTLRGGSEICGGLYWCDWREFEEVPTGSVANTMVGQVFGHTRGKEIRRKGDSWCIDVLEDAAPQGLWIHNKQAEITLI